MRALGRFGGKWRRLIMMLLLWGLSARSVQAAPKAPVTSIQADRMKLWLGGNPSALQASLRNDAFWESSSSIEPPTGRAATRRGSALLALGLLRSATAIMHVVFGSSSRCGPDKRLDWSASNCKNLRLYGFLGMGLSAAFLAGGSIELGRGLMLRRRHDAWKKTHWDHFSSQLSFGGGPVQRAHLRPLKH